MAFDFPSSPTIGQVYQFYTWDGEKWISTLRGIPVFVPTTPGTEAAAFLARTSGLDTTHTEAYTVLINGIVADGLWSLIDVLYIFATNTSANALLNLRSTSFNGTANGSPTFTADRGFTGVDNSSTVYINSNFNPLTSGGSYTQNNAHMSAWSLTNYVATAGGIYIGSVGGGTTNYLLSQNGSTYFRVNGTPSAGYTNADTRGHYLGVRTGGSTITGFKNGAAVLGPFSDGIGTQPNYNILIMAGSNAGTPFAGGGYQFAMASIGNVMNSTQALAFYNRLRTYMTAVGVP